MMRFILEIEQFPSIQTLREINFEKNERLKGNFVFRKKRVAIELHLIAKKTKIIEKSKITYFVAGNGSFFPVSPFSCGKF